ncbi:hypothetical protein PJ267_15200 [Arthrobacter sp. OVS8]|nr:hypothetical protein PJ267_15200 [Arthrobacter sp. OVS8]
MPAATPARAAAWLRHAVLLAALLAVIAGFLGMHILSGSHGVHSQAPPSGTTGHTAAEHAAAPPPAPAHDTLQPQGRVTGSTPSPDVIPAAVTVGGTDVPPSCVCQGGCAEKPAMHVGCTPSPAGATLSAPQPGAALPAARPWTAVRADLPSGYAYRPGTPSPNDLSISRT